MPKADWLRRLSTIEARLSLAKTGGKIAFPQFLEMFRADLLDLKEIMQFLQMGSSAPTTETATVPEVCVCALPLSSTLECMIPCPMASATLLRLHPVAVLLQFEQALPLPIHEPSAHRRRNNHASTTS